MPSASVATALPNGKTDAAKANKTRPPRPSRPNYRHIHRFPLPVHVSSVPVLIPHNPLSLVAVALSYLTCLISPPKQELYTAYFCSATSSVHVTDPQCIRALWEMGFFGKGSLSRSEPSWLEREKKRRGLLGVDTSEEATGQRRVDRREFKLERARKEREAITERLKQEAAANSQNGIPGNLGNHAESPSNVNGVNGTPANGHLENNPSLRTRKLEPPSPLSPKEENGDSTPGKRRPNGTKTVRFAPSVESKEFNSTSEKSQPVESEKAAREAEEQSLQEEEHLQLSNEEAFFLVYGLGVLQIYDEDRNTILPTSSLLPLFRQHSYFPPRSPSTPVEPDDPFAISYVVYHHFRSLGWVVRSGVKFGVDYLLYNRGPVFSHAEFALVILPSYSHRYWSETPERRESTAKKQDRSWWWLHCVNRVQAQVRKSLVLCYVDIPPPSSELSTSSSDAEIDIGKLLSGYTVREMSLKRWVPNRSRD